MPESFGARLRQQRERKRIPLASIVEQTKIPPSLLEALERDDVSHWPGGIFRRSFIRAYARCIGLHPDVVVAEFLALYPDPEDIGAALPVLPLLAERASVSRPPTRLRCLVGAAIAAVFSPRRGRRHRRHGSGRDAVMPARPAPEFVPSAVPVLAPVPAPALVPVAAPALAVSQPEPDLLAAAQLCTELGCICEIGMAAPVLEGAAKILDAIGLIVWVWDAHGAQLRPVLAHGYSDNVLARLPKVRRDADHATAAAFRSAQTCVVHGNDQTNGAVVVPLMTQMGCVGVLAVELRHGGEQRESVRALATIFGAHLATLVGPERLATAVNA